MKELEVKVLDIDPVEVEKRLERLGAERLGSELQKIYTYDFLPLAITVPGIFQFLDGGADERKKIPLRKHLEVLLLDLGDIVGEEEVSKALAGTGFTSFADLLANLDGLPGLSAEGAVARIAALALRVGIDPNKWVRLREAAGRTTITVKQILGRKGEGAGRHHEVGGVREIELEVDGFESARQLLESLGFFHKNYQEKRRTRFKLPDGVMVDIDEWPGIPAYLEIEGTSEAQVFDAAAALGFQPTDLRGMNADDVFAFYGKDMYEKAELRF